MRKKLKIYGGIAAGVILAAMVTMMCTRYEFYEATLKYGLILLALAMFAFLFWKAFIKGSKEDLRRSEKQKEAFEKENARLQQRILQLDRELAEKSRTKLNVVSLNPILHLAVLDINTSFTRAYVREENGMSFNGALRADICAEYGVKLEEAMFKYDPFTNNLSVAGFKPGLVSFSKKQLTWDIARSYHSRTILGHEIAQVSDAAAKDFTSRMCEQLRAEMEKEIDERQVQEFDWIAPMISQQVVDLLRLMLGRDSLNITLAEVADETFVDLATFRRQMEIAEIDAQPERDPILLGAGVNQAD